MALFWRMEFWGRFLENLCSPILHMKDSSTNGVAVVVLYKSVFCKCCVYVRLTMYNHFFCAPWMQDRKGEGVAHYRNFFLVMKSWRNPSSMSYIFKGFTAEHSSVAVDHFLYAYVKLPLRWQCVKPQLQPFVRASLLLLLAWILTCAVAFHVRTVHFAVN
jgi:hypothetical protein